MKQNIIAVDFDGTLCENKWPEIGIPNEELIEYLKIKELYEKEIARGQMTIVENVSDIEVNILEIEAEKLVNIELGGYCE